MRQEMQSNLTRAEISEKVIQLFVDIIGFIDRSQVTEQTDFIHDFKIIDDDLTCFVMQIKWQFKLRATQADWDHITTLEQIVGGVVRRFDLPPMAVYQPPLLPFPSNCPNGTRRSIALDKMIEVLLNPNFAIRLIKLSSSGIEPTAACMITHGSPVTRWHSVSSGISARASYTFWLPWLVSLSSITHWIGKPTLDRSTLAW